MRKSFFLVSFITLVLITCPRAQWVCAGSGKEIVLAEVNGDIIDEAALQERIRTIHRHKPGMRPEGGAGSIEISDLVEEMIDERLMIQEARSLQLDADPDFTKRVESYITTQSVFRLRQEEVLDKISISDDEVLDYVKEHHEKNGSLGDAALDMVKRRIRRKLKQQKEKALTEQFITGLRERANIQIDQRLIDRLGLEKDYVGEKTVVARVNGRPILLDDMLHDMRQAMQKRARMYGHLKEGGEQKELDKATKQRVLDRLITYELIEQEALKRDYAQAPAFMKKVKKHEDRLLVNEFKAKIVYPLAIPTEKELTRYYEEHRDDFKRGDEVWIREMTFESRKEAEKILKELRQGAGFEFLAARVSDGQMPKRGDVWVQADRFSPAVQEALNRLKVGEFSDVVADGRQFKILKLKGRRDGGVVGFSEVVEHVKRMVGEKKFKERLSDYLAKLQKDSKIKINQKALKQIQERYWQESPGQTPPPASAG